MTTSNVTTVKVTPEMIAAEADRNAEMDAALGMEDALDHGIQQDEPADRVEPEPAPVRAKPIQRSPADVQRDAIAARFRRTDEVPFNGDLTDPEMIYGKAGRQPSLEPDPDPSIVGDVIEPEPIAQDAPQMITRKVRGKDVTKSLDDWLIDATKVTAADSYLEESRKLLEDAANMRGKASQHPEGQDQAQNDGSDPADTTREARHPAPDFKSVVEKIQYGDPEEAARDLEKIVDSRVNKSVDEGQLKRLFDNDLAKSQAALKVFRAANPDLATDDLAAGAIERMMYGLYKEDIVNLNVLTEDQIPKDPVALANWHRFYKVHGYDMRSTADLLAKAKDKFVAWRGNSGPKPAPRKEAPRVAVNVDRTERRMAIPNQPTRAAVPRRDPAPAVPAKTPGSDIVMEMRRSRGQIT